MSGKVKTWFVAPNWDIAPTSVKLGTVFFEPTPPFIDKAHAKFVPADEDLTDIPDATAKKNFTATADEVKKSKGGIFARFLGTVPVGGEATAQRDKSAVEHYTVKDLASVSGWVPSLELEKKATESSSVAAFLEQWDYEKPVYMITGIRTAESVTVTTLRRRGRSLLGWFGIDLSPVDVPLTVGMTAEDSASRNEFVSFEDSSKIVFAYQLREIRVSEGNVTGSDYLTNALLDTAGGAARPRDTTAVGHDVGDVALAHLYRYATIDEMDGSECVCISPDAT
ncbi:uncharacterized protein B0I36DRAFT_370133 [Microdochium trichocladiopsis]|uniref:Uncharacterized protein n=1 Tax=Microdochium trichocladiopsis TaxID=1682393 RepID=A0A9P9BHJ4_9PEZI|nr:uncharacterized protein B0I36DRAFT_370133 [Microdochium trichocladiopsis]KAH7010847.1 hypothetical protein B0I36DRAFT_370133 [Microdochium trichocladiopsis]